MLKWATVIEGTPHSVFPKPSSVFMISSRVVRRASRCVGLAVLFVFVVVRGSAAEGLPFLSPIFGDHMVMQRGKPNRVWGWTEPGKVVTVEVAGKRATATADADGRWMATVEVPAEGGPYTVAIEGAGQKVELKDVLVGDVWLCSGQSNMAFPLRPSLGGEEAAKAADYPTLRAFTVPLKNVYEPAAVPAGGQWRVCTPETAPGISAVAFYFARKVQEETGVPIGLVIAASGGSPVEAWTSAEGLARVGEFSKQLKEIARLNEKGGTQHGSFLMHWLEEFDVGEREGWQKEEAEDAAWTRVQLPGGGFAELGVGETPSVCWFRREVELPAEIPEGVARLHLGVVEKMDTSYINGRWVGASSWVENPRAYAIPAGVLKPGKNIIAVRVFRTKPDGGFKADTESFRIQFADGTTVSLAGEWKAKLSVDARPPHPWPLDVENYATMPTTLYNGTLAPVMPLALRGALWYQGEANFQRAAQYHVLMPALIEDWRERFGQGDFPFYMVGLPAFMQRKTEPGTSDGWTELREAQAKTVERVPNTGLATIVDTGDADDIHPREKRTAGERLARLALADVYGKKVASRSPEFAGLERRGSELVLKFKNADGGLVVRGAKLGEFSVAGADGKWHWGHARIEGQDTVVVSAAGVAEPVDVRYAWQANPVATLFNGEGLPAVPFRTK